LIDNGYDISDYQNIMKEFGTIEDFDVLLKGFKDRNIKVLMDMVLNHCSDEHAWFKSARRVNNIKFDKVEEYNDIELLTNYAQVKAKGGDLKRFLEGMKISSRDNGRTPVQ
jgi:oligo-1,6-glucosidase